MAQYTQGQGEYEGAPESHPLKSHNLQYNTLVCWVAGTKDSSTKGLMFQVLFVFHNFLQNPFQKLFQFIFYFSIIKKFECPKSIRNNENNNAWNVRGLVHGSFVPVNQRIIL